MRWRSEKVDGLRRVRRDRDARRRRTRIARRISTASGSSSPRRATTSSTGAVYADASERRIFCNVADVPDLCSFILPAIHRRGPITVAVSTGGASPALAQHLRDRFAAQVGFEHEQLAGELQRIRPWVKQNLHTYEERRDYFRERVAEALG